MSTAIDTRLAGDPRYANIVRLRREIQVRENPSAHAPVLSLGDVLNPLFIDGGLRAGASYRLEHTPALFGALIAEATRKGTRCVVIGMPHLGLEFTRRLGADFEQLILIPEPGRRLLDVISAVSEVVPLVLACSPTRVRESDAARLNSRLRDRVCTLLITSPWPATHAHIACENPQPRGLGKGWGAITEQLVTMTVQHRSGEQRSAHVLLPSKSGRLEAAPEAAPQQPFRPRLVAYQ